MTEGQDWVKTRNNDNSDSLVEITHKNDPDNFFRVTQNIKPE